MSVHCASVQPYVQGLGGYFGKHLEIDLVVEKYQVGTVLVCGVVFLSVVKHVLRKTPACAKSLTTANRTP